MTQALSLQEKLPDHHLEPFLPLESAYKYEDQTPAHTFTTVIVPLYGTDFFLVLTSRDYFEDSLAASLLQFVEERKDVLNLDRPILVLEGLPHPGAGFDSVGVLSPMASNRFEYESKELSSRTFEVFPMYRCEFSGTEDSELINLLRHDYVPTIDWKRTPHPQLYMRLNNAKTGVRSIGPQLGLTTLPAFLDDLRELDQSTDSYIEARNFRGEACGIRKRDGVYNITFQQPSRHLTIPANAIEAWATTFFCTGSA